MKKRIILRMLLIIMTSFLLVFLIGAVQIKKQYRDQFSKRLDSIMAISDIYSDKINDPSESVMTISKALNEAGQECRISLIDKQGIVLADSYITEVRENHSDRPEVIQALQGETGSDIRRSGTTGKEYIYKAHLLNNGLILRAAIDTAEMSSAVRAYVIILLIEHILVASLATVIMWITLKKSLKPLGQLTLAAEKISGGDFDAIKKLPSGHCDDEIGKMAESVRKMSENMREAIVDLQENAVRMENLERLKTEFVGNVTHELKTPLTSIRASIEILLNSDNMDIGTRMSLCSILNEETERLDRLIDDMLILSRLENMDDDPDAGPLVLKDCLEAVTARLDGAISEKNIKVHINADDSMIVYAAPRRIEQLLGNLIENAIKYGKENGNVWIEFKRSGDKAHIVVRDDGRGIPAEHLDRLFERFYRVDKDRSRSVGGTGLGLAIAKHIAVLYGGEISVKSIEGKGSEFTVALPLYIF
ncbi:MAG: HAMP domain-containing protein [Clostridiales bacterium]|nr:HAMP domain-containing protein [Clostridiales bacterium]MBS5878391.1 HAMP domain-containing protein [Clostridiales bacterium]MDU0939825.1 ATP-binding protein [Clostridiales bacterium]MDU1042669.1 ATP-binding protein [Clostridiales bacterium]MDU3489553.1 ATP-binding protein [Clostridiales bacterium]